MNAELREVLGLLEKASNGPLTAEDETHDIGRGMLRHYSVVRDADGENIVRLGYTDPNVHAFAAAVNFLSKHGPALLAAVQGDGLRTLRLAIVTSESCGPDNRYRMVLGFRSLAELQAGCDELRALMAGAARSADAEGR